MTVFGCAGCGAVLTVPLSRVVLPAHALHRYGNSPIGLLLEPGTFAVDPRPYGAPWRLWAEVGEVEAAARGVYAPVISLSYGPAGRVAIAPGDLRGSEFIPERVDGGCCGIDGRDGPNLACVRCGLPIGTRIDDCGYWQAVWLEPQAVRRLVDDDHPGVPLDWDSLLRDRPGTAPTEPDGWISPGWEAAVAAALARLLVASAGVRITVADGPVADAFRRALDAMLPPGPDALVLGLAGPGLPPTDADIVLVPQHPYTGELWKPVEAAPAVPLAWEVWAYLAFPHDHRAVPAAGALPVEARQHDLLPPVRLRLFRPSWDVLVDTLAHLPEVREPWLRAIYDRMRERRFAHPFW